ncbi:YncE family protein, partial [Singulisphaera rosea]
MMRRKSVGDVILVLVMAQGVLLSARPGNAAQPTPARSFLMLSKVDHTLAIVDPSNLAIVARLPVGQDSHEVIATPGGKTAYVSNTGGGFIHEINVLDLVGQKALPSIDTGPMIGPHGLAFVGGKLWFTAQGAKALARFDPEA